MAKNSIITKKAFRTRREVKIDEKQNVHEGNFREKKLLSKDIRKFQNENDSRIFEDTC